MSELDDEELQATRKMFEEKPWLIGGIEINPKMTPKEIQAEVFRMMEKYKAEGKTFDKKDISRILGMYRNCRIEEEER